MSPIEPPVVNRIQLNTTPDGLTTHFLLNTNSGDIAFDLRGGGFSQLVEILLKHLADIAANAKPSADTSRQIVADPVRISGLARAFATNDKTAYLVVVFGKLQITFEVERATLEKFSSDLLAEIKSTPSIRGSTPPDLEPPPSSYLVHPSLSLPVSHKLRSGGPTLTYPALNACAYCKSLKYRAGSDARLTDEHILADGFGGTLVLPNATCEAHQKITTNIEGSILRTIFHAPRAHLGIRSRKKKRKPTSVFPVRATVNDREIVIPLTLEQHPTVLYLLNFGPPGILVGRPKQLGDSRGIWVKAFNLTINKLQASHGIQSVMSDVTDMKRFYQFLAKTAHVLAVAELGLSGFRPLLRKMIEGRFDLREAQHLVGGYPHEEPASDSLHAIALEKRSFSGKTYVAAKLRFFASLGAPTYYVAVGEI